MMAVLILVNSSVAFARVDIEMLIDKGYENKNYIKYDIDLQRQIDTLIQKNIQLESALQNYQAPVVQTNPIDEIQNQKIVELEKKVGVIEKAVENVKWAINKTLDLLQKVINLLTK